jgi:Na+/alanine symporter
LVTVVTVVVGVVVIVTEVSVVAIVALVAVVMVVPVVVAVVWVVVVVVVLEVEVSVVVVEAAFYDERWHSTVGDGNLRWGILRGTWHTTVGEGSNLWWARTAIYGGKRCRQYLMGKRHRTAETQYLYPGKHAS